MDSKLLFIIASSICILGSCLMYGYGDLYPISDIGRTISIISSMVGIAIIALPSGIITAGYMDELKERQPPSKVEDVDNES